MTDDHAQMLADGWNHVSDDASEDWVKLLVQQHPGREYRTLPHRTPHLHEKGYRRVYWKDKEDD